MTSIRILQSLDPIKKIKKPLKLEKNHYQNNISIDKNFNFFQQTFIII